MSEYLHSLKEDIKTEQREVFMKIKLKDYLHQQILKNLLDMHRRMSKGVNAKHTEELISLSKYILKLGEKAGDVLFEFGLEDSNKGGKRPPEKRK